MKKAPPQNTDVSIVIPLYNEAELLTTNIPAFIRYIDKHFTDSEIVLAENGSTDGSVELIDQLSQKHPIVKVIHLPKPSYGSALRAGLLAANKTRVVKLDGDWLNIEFMKGALPLLADFAIVAGSKSLRPELDKRPWIRKVGSKMLTSVLNRFFGYTGGDSRGLKAFRRKEMLKLISESVSDEIIESEIMLRAFRSSIPVSEIPVAIEEVRPPRVGFFRRCGMVARELIKLYKALKTTKKVRRSGLHADDAGLNQKVNNTIENLLKKGLLQSVSLMVNMPDSAEAAKMLRRYPEITIFFHFNLTTGYPVSDTANIPSLVNNQGLFSAAREKFVLRCLLGQVKKNDVAREFEAQWQRLDYLDIKADGIDSEQHAHSLEPIASTVQIFAQEKGIKTIRNFGQMRTITLSGAVRFGLLKLAARLTSVRYNHDFGLPPSWRGDTWQPFVMASWEPINLKKVLPDTVVALHPHSGLDKTITPQIEL